MSEEKVYPIHKDLESRAHIRNDQYIAMYQASIERPEEFWNQKADQTSPKVRSSGLSVQN